jgi:hypothetical protein
MLPWLALRKLAHMHQPCSAHHSSAETLAIRTYHRINGASSMLITYAVMTTTHYTPPPFNA